MNITHFTDDRIDDITSGRAPMTDEERGFLIIDTSSFEECEHSKSDLAAMSDADLMHAAYSTWADYVGGQY
jgi:hypothetical protein